MLSLSPVRWLSLGIGALVLGHLVGLFTEAWFGWSRTSGILRQFDLNGEGNLAAWYESLVLFVAAAVALAIYLAHQGRHPLAARWGVLAGLLGLMAVDEAAQLHDMATGPLRRGLELEPGALYFAWVIPALVILTGAAIYLFPLMRALPTQARSRLLLAMGVYVGGALVIEMISGFAVAEGHDTAHYYAVITLEETLELAGAVLLVAALMAFLRSLRPTISIQLLGAKLHGSVVAEVLATDSSWRDRTHRPAGT